MTLQKLAHSQTSVQVAYRIKKLIDHVNQKMKHASKHYQDTLGKKYGKLTEKDEITPTMNDYGFELAEGADEESLKKEVAEFGEKEVTVDRAPLTVRDLDGIKLSAGEITALDVFLEDPEATEHSALQQELPLVGGNQKPQALKTA